MKAFLLKRIVFLFLFFLVLCVILPLIYLIIDNKNLEKCLPQVADRLGVEPGIWAIYHYIENSVEPGMDRSDVMQAFEAVGPVSIRETSESDLDEGYERFHEVVSIEMCSHPRQFLYLAVLYSSDRTLIQIELDMPEFD